MGIHDVPGPKILILTVAHGASHLRLAHSLRKALVKIRPSLSVEIVNTLEHCTGWFRAYYDSYRIPLKYWPAFWGWIESKQHTHSSTGPGWLYRRGSKPLFRFIQAFRPDAVVATEVGVLELAAMLKRETRAHFLLVGVPTDMDLDRAWAQRDVDFYPVASANVAGQLEAWGVPRTRILPCGVPVDPAFGSLTDRAAVRTSLGLDPDLPVLLVLFGGAGHGRPSRIVAEIKKLRGSLQAVFIAGRNRRLEEDLKYMCVDRPHYRVLGWVDNMPEWMAAADLALGKPGASTLVEAINSRLPLLAFDPLPGNERRACDLIEKWEVGYWIRQPAELAATLERLLAHPAELSRLRANARALARPQAAREAAKAILKGWQSHR
jgi:processive 1,2-diacylglycerol beta-glucosyltransferase